VWFLTRASSVLGRDDLLRRANELALRLPVRSPNPDLAHGTAGVGLGQLHQWMRTGDDRFLARAVLAADHLVRTAERAGGGITWPVPADAPSRLAGTVSYGFAHGTAGVAAFLLVAGAATGDGAFTKAAIEALDGLLELAVTDDDGAAFWPMGPDDDTLWAHWCNGSSGVGTAMLRAFQVTGDARYREAAESAALAGWRERWRSSTVQCHGLAGNAEFLLDVHQVTGDARYQVLAAEAAEVMLLQRRRDGAHTVFADDTGGGLSAAYGTGMAGLAMFFLRLTGGGRRALMLDQLLGVRR
jgi:lantibiotic modifying enzyme